MSASNESTSAVTDDLPPARAIEAAPTNLAEYVKAWWRNVKAGQIGSLPIVLALVVIVLVFGLLEENFLTARNFTNLLLQMAGIATIAIGIVFVLLLGEIDLSVAYVGAVGGIVMTLFLRPDDPGWPWWLAILAGLLCTTLIGLVQGTIVAKFGVPSFVVTLAGFLIWSGVVLILTTEFSTAGTIIIQDRIVRGIANNFLADVWGWILGVVVIVGYLLAQLNTIRSRRASGLDSKPMPVVAVQTAMVAVVVLLAVYWANKDRGVPMATLILLVLLLFWSLVSTRTRFGRHVYAVGGNAEAARRAGISVDRIRIAVFAISGFMAGAGGIILASRLRSVSTNDGGGNLLLNIIAAAVIGGTSLFGGEGRVASAFLGALVITAVQNGMDLYGLSSGWKFVITGLVLLAAVLIDSLARRSRAVRGVR